MSGGQLVVLDRLGRDVKRFPLEHGLVTLGSDHSCDIRFMLDTVSPHHATVAVHANQTLVRNVCGGETLVNGRGVSVAALRHGDIIGIGGRALRWDYADPAARRPQQALPALSAAAAAAAAARGAGARGRRRGSAGAARRLPALKLQLSQRASMPANAGGKQVAIVQPQRRDTNDQNDKPSPRTLQSNKRRSKNELDISMSDSEVDSKRKSSARASIKSPVSLQNTTKATLWIESRKSSPRQSAKLPAPRKSAAPGPLRLAVLKRAQAAHALNVTKIEEPLKIDHTKQAAILLMTGHTPKSRLLGQKTPSPKTTPNSSIRTTVTLKTVTPKSVTSKTVTPKSGARRSASFVVKKKSPARRPRASAAQDPTVTILEITDSDARNSTLRSSSRRNTRSTLEKTPLLSSPRKSALKNPLANKSMRKTESIKFDLSNLENYSKSDVLMVTDTTGKSADSVTEDDLTLHYETSSVQSPSPRRSIHSRSSKMLEKSLGTTLNVSSPSRTLTPASPRPRKSLRGSVILQKALNESKEKSPTNRRSTKSDSCSGTALESYSIVDLVSIDSNESGRSTSVYNSASANTTAFGTPRTTARNTRSTLNPILVDSSTPYVRATRSYNSNATSRSSSSGSRNRSSVSSRKTKSVSTPDNIIKSASVSTRVSRASRSRSRINDSDLMVVESEADDSPRSSKRISTTSKRSSSAAQLSYTSNNTTSDSSTENEGISTPENRHSPEEATTPVLSIQSLLDSSQSSIPSRSAKRGRPSLKRKTIGVPSRHKTRVSAKSKSMNFSARQTRLRLSSDSYENMNVSVQSEGEIVTPKSAVKLVQEAVKNKHSTAKKPQSKRSIIDDLNESDIVKQLFNSPVKRKLSQSMTEFSRRQLLEDDEVQVRRPTRNTVALSGRTPDRSLMEHSQAYTPERFVSPISTPSHSPNLTGIKLMFAKNTPENDLRNVRGVKALLRTPRARKSIKNELTDVAGVKVMFARSPKNRLSDVRVKEVFASSPKNDLTRVSGVKSLFRSQQERKSPRNSLSDVRGVKKLFTKKSPANDLRNVSGVKKALQRNTPKNDLSDVRGLKRMFRRDKRNELNDLSGVEELFNESNQSHRDTDSLFDQLIGKPTIKAVYSKTLNPKSVKKNKRNTKSLHVSLDVITNNVEEWLEQELQKRLQTNKSKANITRELQKLATDTVEGTAPIRTSRVRNSTIVRTSVADGSKRKKSASELYSAHTLPIKKRSIVDASLEKTKNDSKPVHLPIKKRVVLHSTPVKGRVNMTMNASELGRVSPIVADKTQDLDHDVPKPNRPKAPVEARSRSRRNTKAPPSPKLTTKSPRKTRGKSVLPTKVAPATPTKDKSPAKSKTPSPAKKAVISKAKSLLTSKKSSPVKKPASPIAKSPAKSLPIRKPLSPKTKPSKPAKPPSPVAKAPSPKATRSRKTVAVSTKVETKAKKRRATLVVAKKTPVMSPVPRASRKRTEATLLTSTATPKKTRATRNKEIEKPKTPKNTRAKVQKATVVVVKPSPQLKPRATRAKALTDNTISKAKKTVQKKVVSPKKSPVKKPVKEVTVPKTRGRKATNDVLKQSDVVKAQPKTKRGRNTTAEEPVVARKTRRIDIQEPVEVELKTKGKKVEKIEEPKRTRGKQLVAQESVQSEPTTRSRRAAKFDNTAPEINTRKRKITASDDRPAKVSKSKEKEEVQTRGRNRKEEKEVIQTLNTRGRNKKTASPKAETVNKKAVAKQSKEKTSDVKKTTRAKPEVSVEVPNGKKLTRGRKVAVVESAPVGGKRKRKTAAESSVEPSKPCRSRRR